MLLCVATIATGAISCENKEKKDAVESTKQETMFNQQETETQQEAMSEKAKHDKFVELYTQKMYKEGRSNGYNSGSSFESYREEEWYKNNLSMMKAVWLQGEGITSEDMKVFEEAYKKGHHEGWAMAQSDK